VDPDASSSPTTSPATSTTLVGPAGTAPGMGFVQPQAKPVDDSTIGRGTGLPLAVGALIILVVFLAVVVRAARQRRARTGA
jgi:hypothetical protein